MYAYPLTVWSEKTEGTVADGRWCCSLGPSDETNPHKRADDMQTPDRAASPSFVMNTSLDSDYDPLEIGDEVPDLNDGSDSDSEDDDDLFDWNNARMQTATTRMAIPTCYLNLAFGQPDSDNDNV